MVSNVLQFFRIYHKVLQNWLFMPNAEKVDIPAISSAVSKYQCLDDMDREWWVDFLSQLDASFHVDAERHDWLLSEIEKLVHAIPHTKATNYNTTLPHNLLKRHADHLKGKKPFY